MATSVTISGSDGSSLVALTGNDYVNSHLSMFQSMTAQFATQGFNTFNASSNQIDIVNNFGTVAVTGGASSGPANIVVGDGTNLTYIGGSSDVQIVGGNGNDLVFAGSGNDTLALGTGSDQIYLGSGTTVVSVQGADFIQAGSGNAGIAVEASGATINGGFSGTLLVDLAGGTSSTINVINGTNIFAASGATATVNAFGDTTITGLSGSTTQYDQLNGTLKFVGIGGSVSVAGGAAAGNDTLYGASGANIVLTGSAHNNVFVANDPNYADGGPVTLDGSAASGGNQFWAGSGNASLIGGVGGDTLVGGQGHATIVGGVGSSANFFDLFAAGSGSGTSLTIEHFGEVASNQLTLFGFGGSAAASIIAGAQQSEAGVTLNLSNGASILLTNVSKSMLNTTNVVSTS